MKLLSCHIDNFGCLSDYNLNFDGKKTVILEENGWGKSTFAAFLRVMFYGLTGAKKKSLSDNDRKRFLPWQGGVYGGSLTFYAKGKTYTLTRHFKEKDSTDFFELRDAETNLPSRDFSENIGEELFGIDSESFARTVFVGQDDIPVDVTSGINAKLGNLAEESGDMNRFTDAMDIIKGELNALSSSRKTGEIYKLTDKIAALETEERSGYGLEKEMETVSQKITEANGKKLELKAKKADCEKRETEANDQERLQSAYSMLNNLKGDLEKKKAELQNAKRAFPNEVPTEDELQKAYQAADAYKTLADEVKRSILSEEEEARLSGLMAAFGTEIPDEGTFRTKSREIQSAFSKRNEILHEIDRAEERIEDAEKNEAGETKKKIGAELLLIPALCLIAGAVAVGLFLRDFWVYALIAGVAGVILLILALVLTGKHKKLAQEFSEDVTRLTNARDASGAELDALDRNAAAFLDRFGLSYDPGAFYSDCSYIADELSAYRTLKSRKTAADEASSKSDGHRKLLHEFCQKYGFMFIGDPEQELVTLREKRIDYAHAEKDLSDAEKSLSDFAKDQDMEKLEFFVPSDTIPRVEDVREEKEQLNGQIEDIDKEIRHYEDELESLQERFDEWERASGELEEKKEEKERLQKKNDLLKKTQAALQKANEALTTRFAKPVLDALKEYYGMVEKNHPDDCRLDAHSTLTVMAFGEQREIGTFSKGCQDYLGLCYRFALVHAMYADEKPFIILDDPFTNLDSERLSGAKALLEKLSDEYQIVYFTCHESRE